MMMLANRMSAALIALAIGGATIYGQGPPPPPGQPAPPAQGRGRGGGGFRQPDPIDFDEHDGWTSLFDGKTLNGWSGDSNWKVEDGAITIEPTCEKPTGTVYLVWQGGDAADFELRLRMKGTGNINGGVQYRGWIAPLPQRPGGGGGGQGRGTPAPCPSGAPRGTPPDPRSEEQWNMRGAQYDFDADNRYTGQFYEQSTGRGIVAWKGQAVRTETGKSPRLVATLGDKAAIDGIYRPNDWNDLHIIAIGTQMTHLLNGRVISILYDEDPTKFHKAGKIGIEVEATGKLFTKDIWLKKLP
jgi:3-keto-disaccharide hydrolase